MVVYLDVLLLVDLVVDYFLLLSVKRITMSPGGKLRLFLGAIPAAVSSLILLCPRLPLLLNLLYMAVTAAIVVFIAFPNSNWRTFLHRALWYFAVNLGFGGIIYCLAQFCGMKGVLQNNLAVYIQVSPLLLLGSIIGVYLVLKLLLLFGEPHGAVTKNFQIRIGGYEFFAEVLLDTGFRLSDCMTGQPVLLITDLKRLPQALYKEVDKYRAGEETALPFRLIPAGSVFGEGLLAALTADWVACKGKKLTHITIAFSEQPPPGEPVEALAGPQLIETVL